MAPLIPVPQGNILPSFVTRLLHFPSRTNGEYCNLPSSDMAAESFQLISDICTQLVPH